VDELTLALVTALATVTIAAAVEYYRQVRRAQREYDKAKVAIEDIVLSFNRQFRREEEKLEAVAYKVEAAASRSSNVLNIVEDVGKRVTTLETKMGTDFESRQKVIGRLDEVEKGMRDVAASQDTMTAKITSLEERAKQLPAFPEAGFEAVIPIRREKAMSHLTDTELSALEIFASEGPKTAPEIKEKVRLSREHTARLMKKLYEQGYLERETGKIPFKYSLKKEMEKLLKKAESPST
jgi:hypothetical protein